MIIYPKKNKAAILVKQNFPLVVDEVLMPKKLLRGQVLVKIFYSGICGSQLGEIVGIKGKDKYLPHLMGHEATGEVIDVHVKVSKVKRGDNVLLHWMPSTGMASENPEYTWKGRKVNAGTITTFYTYAIVSENKVSKLKKNLSYEKELLLLGCTASTAIGAVDKLANIKKGQTVAVSGCGSVGLNIIKTCQIYGAKNIIAIDIHEEKLKFARKFGANYFINSTKKKFKKVILNKFKNLVDHFFECTGNVKVISDAYECLSNTGKEILIGVPKYKQKANFYTLDLHLGKQLIGCKGGNFKPQDDLLRYLNFIKKKQYQIKKHITHQIELKDINDVFSDMRKNKVIGKCIINFL